jgi:hypothetical protein
MGRDPVVKKKRTALDALSLKYLSGKKFQV